MPNLLSIIVRFVWDLLQWCALMLPSRESLGTEILFLRRQLAMYHERGVKPKRIDGSDPSGVDVSVAVVRLAICIR